MTKLTDEQWEFLCDQVFVEEDPQKRLELIEKMFSIIAERAERTKRRANPVSEDEIC
jgi:hypothetical protein